MILKVIWLVSRSGGEIDGVVTYATEPNQCTDAFKPIFSFDELLYYGRVRGSLRSFGCAYCKIKSLSKIWNHSQFSSKGSIGWIQLSLIRNEKCLNIQCFFLLPISLLNWCVHVIT